MLVVMRPKYNRRQAELERRFQAREFVSERRAQEETQQAERADKAALGDAHDETDELTEPPPVRYSTPKNKLIELSPLAIVLGVGLVVSLVGLVRQLHSSVEETTSTEEADRQTGVSPGEST